MPTYEYFCESCGSRFEAVQRFSDAPLSQCPTGHEGVRRVINPAGIIFKGSGWYIKDSKSDGSSTTGTSSKAAAKSESASTSSSESAASPKSEAA
jgi:putative FmdB family regulatory protein